MFFFILRGIKDTLCPFFRCKPFARALAAQAGYTLNEGRVKNQILFEHPEGVSLFGLAYEFVTGRRAAGEMFLCNFLTLRKLIEKAKQHSCEAVIV